MVICPKVIHPKDADGMTNSLGPDQRAPLGEVRSGSAVCSDLSLQILGDFMVHTKLNMCSLLQCVLWYCSSLYLLLRWCLLTMSCWDNRIFYSLFRKFHIHVCDDRSDHHIHEYVIFCIKRWQSANICDVLLSQHGKYLWCFSQTLTAWGSS